MMQSGASPVQVTALEDGIRLRQAARIDVRERAVRRIVREQVRLPA